MGEWYADTAMPDDGKSYPFFPIPGNSSRTDKNFTIVDLPEIKSKPGDEKIHGHEQIWEAHTFLIIDEKPIHDVHWQRTGTYNQKMKKFDIKYSILETTKPVDNVFYFDPLGDDTIRSGYKNGSGPNENPVPDPVTPILYPNPINKKYRK
jgi:hypothetical protein